ncbi:flavodoxin family protein [Alkalihalobacillus sp. AL-G]|uniref:flavodoxin family protein n=1 Tax=Alkalihalobacillus sp. AL-G TaxID=2926399 RepID=UPI00272A3D00|nr:flavodoxin family protein [Alkalihalobacillus sp. AL-G]WLD94204.1 flavodoxin family protein [Alkalihalobacillus sp. AL-G]
MKILAINGSARDDGNTELLTKKALDGLDVTHIHLRDFNIRPIDDLRHTEGGFQPVEDDNDRLVEMMLDHDILVFATPVYWYGMSGIMKNLIDRWSQNLRDSRFDFKDKLSKKTAYVICCGGDNPKLKALPLIQQFSYIFDFVSMEFGGYIIGKGNQPGEVLNDIEALAQAEQLNKHLN